MKQVIKFFAIFLVLGVIVGIYLGAQNSSKTTSTEIPSTIAQKPVSTSTETTTQPPQQPTWKEVIRWEGSSIKDTETFHITSNEWRIRWSTKPGKDDENLFSIHVYESNGKWKGDVGGIWGEGSDVSYMRGPGDYYLKIITGQPYVIVIEEKK